ncbi:MAG: hypothetical protein JWM34_512 [Ilumatobacteraceae bacterium]|nr:hypothetical protein [Ilumatobacteraceae bacterium]
MVRRGIVFAALFLSAITSPYLENAASDHIDESAIDISSTSTVTAATTLGTIPPFVAAPTTVAPATTTPTPATGPATTGTVDPSAPTTTATATALDPNWKAKLSPDYVVGDAGCASDLSAAGLAAFFAQPLGAIQGFDGPRIYPLGDGRNLWMLQDTFIDYIGGIKSFAHMNYANSTALIQDGNCFTSLQRGDGQTAQSFEIGTGLIDFDHYFWPAGGSVRDGKLEMYWMQMVRDHTVGGPLDGLSLHPEATWLATYDISTMQRLSFVPAPNPGVTPVWGYTVVDSDGWSYLFGNTYQQNLALEGGYDDGPHSATKMYLARVPQGQLDTPPSYWTGTDWSSVAGDAQPISSRFWTENSMLPQHIGGQWISATKVNGFLGSTFTIDVADQPWGPYRTVLELPATPRGPADNLVTYHALVLPWLDPSGQLIVSLSQIPLVLGADDAPPRYRPNFFTVGL